jgi:hypothetical protein
VFVGLLILNGNVKWKHGQRILILGIHPNDQAQVACETIFVIFYGDQNIKVKKDCNKD